VIVTHMSPGITGGAPGMGDVPATRPGLEVTDA
jgi:hypothetical protein